MDKPRPCPLCGGEALVFCDADGFYVQCQSVGCSANVACYMTEEEAIDAWSRRRVPQEIKDLVIDLQEQLEDSAASQLQDTINQIEGE